MLWKNDWGRCDVTKHELSQVYYLNSEIEMLRKELADLETRSIKGQQLTGMPSGKNGTGDPVGDRAAKIADLKHLIEINLDKLMIQRKRITEYIISIDDSMIRQILYLRYISCLTWRQVAAYMGRVDAEDSIRKMHDRFLHGK